MVKNQKAKIRISSKAAVVRRGSNKSVITPKGRISPTKKLYTDNGAIQLKKAPFIMNDSGLNMRIKIKRKSI